MKHYIITGPELTSEQYLIGQNYIKSQPDFELADKPFFLDFPEREMGACQTRKILDEYLEAGDQIFLTTRYGTGVLHMLRNEVSQHFGMVQGSVVTLLFRNKDSTEPTIHGLDVNGTLGDAWPMGILW